jgi:hypothetical protein
MIGKPVSSIAHATAVARHELTATDAQLCGARREVRPISPPTRKGFEIMIEESLAYRAGFQIYMSDRN